MSDSDKLALLNGTATIQTKIEILPLISGESMTTLTEENGIIDWDYEDFRYVKDEGFIGQFVARQLTGSIKNISDNFTITDREIILHFGVKVDNTVTWYNLGNFLVTKADDDEVNDKTTFEALDYAKKFNKVYENTISYPCTAKELAQNVCEQCGVELGSTSFKNENFVVSGNPFTNNESCRDVLKAIGKLAYTWVRIDWDNKVYLDFDKETTIDVHNKINNSKYYNLTTQKEKFGPVNRVVIGYKDIEGERTKIEDRASIEQNGLCEITIFDNPLVYNQELREQVITQAGSLIGLEYMPLNTLTVGHPWLKGKELIEVTDMENVAHKTIPFDRTIQYFGHIKTLIDVGVTSKTNTEYAYNAGISKQIRKTELMVNKELGEIKGEVSNISTTVENITTTTQQSVGDNKLYITDALDSNAMQYVINGNSEQKTRSGRNLYDVNDMSTSSNNVTIDDDDWITITYDNSTGTSTVYVNYWTNNLDLKVSTNYNIIMEVKSVSGTGSINAVNSYNMQGQFLNGSGYEFSALTNNSIVQVIRQTKDSFDGITQGLRTFATFNAGRSGSITFRLSVLQDTNITSDTFEYEKYGVSPSPEYPQEIDVIEGYNLFDKDNANIITGFIDSSTQKLRTSTISKTLYIPCFPNKTYTITKVISARFGVATASSIPSIGVTCEDIVQKHDFTDDKITITTNENAKYLLVFYYNANVDTLTEQEILNSIQIVKGNIVAPYVPYGYLRLHNIGKNFFNIASWSNVTLAGSNNDTNGSIQVSNDSISIENYNGVDLYTSTGIVSTGYTVPISQRKYLMDVEPNTQYTISFDVDGTESSQASVNSSYYSLIDKDYKSLSAKSMGQFVVPSEKHSITITTTSDTKYLAIRFGSDKIVGITRTYSNIQIEKGNKATECEIYSENNINLDLKGNFIGKIEDDEDKLIVENSTTTLTKSIVKEIWNGTENWRKSNTNGTITSFFLEKDDVKLGSRILSSHFTYYPMGNVLSAVNVGITTHESVHRIYITLKGINDVASLQNYLSNNPVTVYYVLDTSYDVNLDTTNIPLFEGINNISLLEDLNTTTSIQYYRNTPIAQDYVTQQQLGETNNNLSDTTNKTDKNTSDINETNTNLNNNYYNKNQIDVINSSTSQEITTLKNEVQTKVTAEELTIAINQIKTTSASSIETSTGYTFDENGLKIQKSNSEMSSLLDNNGLVVKRNTTEVLTVRSTGVEAENIKVRTYFTIGDNTRAENYKGGTGFFYIGDD